MRRTWPILTLFSVLCLATAVAARTPQQDADSKSTDKSKSTEAKNQVTLQGCLQSGTEPNTFTLTNATTVSPTSTTNPSSSTAAMATTYRLKRSDGVDLKAHVGHKVEVTGTLAEHGKSAEQAKKGKELARAETEPTVTVKSLKHISPTCP